MTNFFKRIVLAGFILFFAGILQLTGHGGWRGCYATVNGNDLPIIVLPLHGSSQPRTIHNAVRNALKYAALNVNPEISARLLKAEEAIKQNRTETAEEVPS